MPEGPECRLTIDYLNKTLVGKQILDWIFCGGRYTEEYPEGYEEFDSALPLKVKEVSCKGKFIYLTLSDQNESEYYIMHSLMMTGRWQKNHDDYCKWFLEVEGGMTLWFRDPRSFATLIFTKDKAVLEKKINQLGPDIMTRAFSLSGFKRLIQKYSKRNITSFLMDQGVISGVGNYIKAESLWYACISPLRKAGDLVEREIECLYEGLRIIPRVSYNRKGLSLRDYANENGQHGHYSRELKIYGKQNAKKTRTADGRTTHWDPRRQI